MKDGIKKQLPSGNEFPTDGFSKDGHSADGFSKDGHLKDGDLLNLLTPREKEVLVILTDGSTNKETAQKLNISVRTVETHRKNIMQKLNIKNIAGLIKFSITHKLTLLE